VDRILKALLWSGAVCVLVSNALVLALRWLDPPLTAFMLQQAGPLSSIDREWVKPTRISPHAAWAVISAEDQKFFDHRGFDVESIAKAIEAYRAGDDLRGASTITQQVAKNLFLWPGRSFVRKGLEVYLTLLIELYWSKPRILEVYLNVAEFGDHVFGVEAAARRFFGTTAENLTRAEAALLTGVLPSPKRLNASHPSDYLVRRQSWIMTQMRRFETQGHYAALEWR